MLKFDDDQNIITVKMKVNDSILAMKGLLFFILMRDISMHNIIKIRK